MIKKARTATLGFIAMFAVSTGLLSCNSSDETVVYNTVSYSSTAITSFSLDNNDKILYNLDSVYFSIDLNNARIFNATPLPYGTRTDSMLITLATDNCSEVELRYKTRWGNDTVLSYDEEATFTEALNFSDGPVVLHVVSYDGLANRNYNIYVNVYEEEPDSMHWNIQSNALPTSLKQVNKSKTVEANGRYYTLTTDGSAGVLSTTDHLYFFNDWSDAKAVDFSFVPNVESLTGSPDGKLYILSDDNELYTSSDYGTTWESTGCEMSYIYGVYQTNVVGCVVEDGEVYTLSYPGSSDKVKQAADFPVSGTSALLSSSSSWEVTPYSLIVGGELADGSMTGDTWGYDGSKWIKISSNTLDKASGRTVYAYTVAETDSTNWRTSYRQVLLAMGGKLDTGEMVDSVSYSPDLGLHWFKAADGLQLPEGFPMLSGSQVFVESHVLTTVESRAIAPITEWPCPYIYMFGGYSDSGVLNKEVWQGVLQRYTLVPLE